MRDTSPLVDSVLSGEASYDDLAAADQASVRAAWERRDTETISGLDFTKTCPQCGLPYEDSPVCLIGSAVPATVRDAAPTPDDGPTSIERAEQRFNAMLREAADLPVDLREQMEPLLALFADVGWDREDQMAWLVTTNPWLTYDTLVTPAEAWAAGHHDAVWAAARADAVERTPRL